MSGIDPNDLKNQDKTVVINPVPTILTIKDLVVVIGVVFAIASSYYTSDNRHTTTENSVRSIKEEVSSLKSQMDLIHRQGFDTKAEFRVSAEQYKAIQNEVLDLKSRMRELEAKK